jgi:hypothetical protein
MRRYGHIPIVLILGVMGCDRRGSGSGLDDSTFVATMAELRRVHGDTVSSAAQRDSARLKVLQTRGLTPAELDRHARELAEDPERAVELWQAVERKLAGLPAPPSR